MDWTDGLARRLQVHSSSSMDHPLHVPASRWVIHLCVCSNPWDYGQSNKHLPILLITLLLLCIPLTDLAEALSEHAVSHPHHIPFLATVLGYATESEYNGRRGPRDKMRCAFIEASAGFFGMTLPNIFLDVAEVSHHMIRRYNIIALCLGNRGQYRLDLPI